MGWPPGLDNCGDLLLYAGQKYSTSRPARRRTASAARGSWRTPRLARPGPLACGASPCERCTQLRAGAAGPASQCQATSRRVFRCVRRCCRRQQTAALTQTRRLPLAQRRRAPPLHAPPLLPPQMPVAQRLSPFARGSNQSGDTTDWSRSWWVLDMLRWVS